MHIIYQLLSEDDELLLSYDEPPSELYDEELQLSLDDEEEEPPL
ncbi:hypothetical protein ABNIH4_16648 [Acinetobacter baumannii ABNIH4]|nr:hypothetical protein ABNIH1_19210 [Acinetobacter baumannii ABNIH1]EGT88830.1 hypothetical protein ABNIH2_19090 [Acinetobacter baumannii ABNIH2]EGT99422.1 hypothetical protein ABNIH4_16648 [Acinetobacter baumannii ABNIH4]